MSGIRRRACFSYEPNGDIWLSRLPADRAESRYCGGELCVGIEHRMVVRLSRLAEGGGSQLPASLPPSARYRWSRAERLGRCRDLTAKRLQRGDEDLRERRERLDRVRQNAEWDLGTDRERRLLQPLARLGAERVGARQPTEARSLTGGA